MSGRKLPEWPDFVKPEDMSIAFLWTNFAGHVLPPEAGPTQREEMRKAFFAGFTECFKVINDYCTRLNERDAVALLDRLNQEALAFYKRMKEEHPI
jgi:hypothetical protein